MKYNIFKNLLLGATVVAAMTSCDENSWNKDYLDGFEEPTISDVRTVEMTLPTADYAKIAKLKANIAIAQELDTKNGGGDTYIKALAAVANGYFSELAPASKYVPAYLDSLQRTNSSSLIGLSDKSYLKLTYQTSDNAPEQVAGMCASQAYTVSEADYQTVWGSEEDFVEAFSPSKKASKFVPGILKAQFPNAKAGDYVVVTYNEAGQDPIFKSHEEPVPSFEMSSVLGTAQSGDDVEVAGVIKVLGSQGFLVEDKSGAMAVYMGSSFDYTAYKVGDQVKFSASVSYRASNSYNQLLIAEDTEITVVGNEKVTYPTPKAYTSEELDALIAEMVTSGYITTPVYAAVTGVVSISGNYYNLTLPGANTAQGSILWGTSEIKELLDGLNGQTVTLTGYIVSKSSSKYINMLVTGVSQTVSTTALSRSVEIASDKKDVVYTFADGAWKVASDITLVNDEDYASMGIKNFNNTTLATYLPIFLKNKFPYAQADDVEYVAYKYYDTTTKSTVMNCSECTFDGSEWVFAAKNLETAQFALISHKWTWDPSVVITLPAGKNLEPSQTFYQTCTNWVYENIDKVQYGSESITSGKGFVTTYGNNEYYSGCSAYQGNVDLRAASAVKNAPEGAYDGMTDEEIVALMKKRFEQEVCPGALAILYPDATPIAGLDLLYTINFTVYTGSSTSYSIVYKVVSKGQFEFVSCTWND